MADNNAEPKAHITVLQDGAYRATFYLPANWPKAGKPEVNKTRLLQSQASAESFLARQIQEHGYVFVPITVSVERAVSAEEA